MEIEQLEIQDFLKNLEPLNQLDEQDLNLVTNNIEIEYIRKNQVILDFKDISAYVYLIRSGAIDIYNTDDELYARRHDGEWFAYSSVLQEKAIGLKIIAIEDCLLYAIPASVFITLVKSNKPIKNFFHSKKSKRIRSAIRKLHTDCKNVLLNRNVLELNTVWSQIVTHDISIKDVAKQMNTTNATAILVSDDNGLCGIVTDRNFCTKVVANSINPSQPISKVMTKDLITTEHTTLGSEALLLMTRNNINHLPIIKDGKPVGILSATDLIRSQGNNAIFLVNEIFNAENLSQLKDLSSQLPQILLSAVNSGLKPNDVNHAISSIGRAINQKLLLMAEQELGPPPVAYAWVVAGSLARNEQTAHSDQDNLIILDNDYKEQKHGDYFTKLANFVCDGLNECGYVYCPGDVMASNQKWRQPLAIWHDYFADWIMNPQPKALMYASIFFDLRCIHGKTELLTQIQNEFLKKSKNNSIFLSYMAANALQYQPPLGLFRGFVLEKTGTEKKALNMKKRGVVPIIDLARVYALTAGIFAINTEERLHRAYEAKVLSKAGMRDLLDAFEFISVLRLEHQAQQIAIDETPDNYVLPNSISSLERKHLKDAFAVVSTMQSAMESTYT